VIRFAALYRIFRYLVMPGLVPGIHVFIAAGKASMAGTSPGHDGTKDKKECHATCGAFDNQSEIS
jgi:hypothetical protein